MTFKQWLKRATGFQKAVYWSPDSFDDFSKRFVSPPIEIKCRWEDFQEDYTDREGVIRRSAAKIMTLYELEMGGILWFGKLSDVEFLSDPLKNKDAAQIQKIDKASNFKNQVTLYTATV